MNRVLGPNDIATPRRAMNNNREVPSRRQWAAPCPVVELQPRSLTREGRSHHPHISAANRMWSKPQVLTPCLAPGVTECKNVIAAVPTARLGCRMRPHR
jgi:hypothetical protein